MPNLPWKKDHSPSKNESELFILEITPDTVKSAAVKNVNNKDHIYAISSSQQWDGENHSSLVSSIDKSISSITEPNGIQKQLNVILGIPSDWVNVDKIIPDRLNLLKQVTQQLDIRFTGYVVTSDAVTKFIKDTDGVPSSVIVTRIGGNYIETTLIRAGRGMGSNKVLKSDSLSLDFIESLARFGPQDLLPSRVIIYGDSKENLEKAKQDLLEFHWQSHHAKIPFLHLPKIEVKTPDFSIRSLLSATSLAEVSQEKEVVNDEKISKSLNDNPNGIEKEPEEFQSDLPQVSDPDQVSDVESQITPNQLKSSRKITRNKLITIGLILLVVLISSLVYFPKSTVNITLSPQVINESFNFNAQFATASSELSTAQIKNVFEEKTETKETTGSKLVGDKATGTVTVINGTSNPRTFPKSTEIISQTGGLKFILDEEVSLVAASGSADPNTYVPGKKDVKVTALAIGQESNLSAGTQFRIGTFSTLDYVARNDTAFSGGSSRQAKSVSKSDYDSLRKKLSEEVKSLSEQNLKSSILQEEEYLVEESVVSKITKESASKKIDEISDSLSMTIQAQSSATVISRKDILTRINSEISSKILENYSIVNGPDFNVETLSSDKNKVDIKVSYSATALPRIDIESIRNEIKGKTQEKAKSHIESIPGVTSVEIIKSPNLPWPFSSISNFTSRIDVSTKTLP